VTDAEWLADFTDPTNPHAEALVSALAAKQDSVVAGIYNAKDETTPWQLDPPSLARVAAKTGLRVVIEEGCASADLPTRSICLTLRDMLTGGRISLDLTDPDIVSPGGVLDSLVAAVTADAGQRAAIRGLVLASGSVATSRADRLGGYPTTLSPNDVARITGRP